MRSRNGRSLTKRVRKSCTAVSTAGTNSAGSIALTEPCSLSRASLSSPASWPSSASRSPDRAISSIRSCGVSSRSPTVLPMLLASRG